MPKISIIIPIWGVERYIEQCARSLFEQTMHDLEYIFVNDCTPDQSIEILNRVLEDYPQRKLQVKIVNHEKNQGQAVARRTGIAAATGEYIVHCDSDDWVESDMYEKLYAKALDENLDYVWCDFRRVGLGVKEILHQDCEETPDDLITAILEGKVMGSLWGGIMRRSIHQDVLLPVGNYMEDMTLMVQYMCKAKKIGHLHEALYNYRMNDNSISNWDSAEFEKIYNNAKMAEANVRVIEKAFEKEGKDYTSSIHILKKQIKNSLATMVRSFTQCMKWNGVFKEMNTRLIVSCTMRERCSYILIMTGVYPYLRPIFTKDSK